VQSSVHRLQFNAGGHRPNVGGHRFQVRGRLSALRGSPAPRRSSPRALPPSASGRRSAR
jgi:hypothetical protein